MGTKTIIAYFDGASKGNPGPAGIGGVLLEDGRVLREIKGYIGTATNNQAEYSALIQVLETAKEMNVKNLSVHSDSELVVRQLSGQYQVKDHKLKPLYDKVKTLQSNFQHISFQHVPREQNKLADALANEGVAERQGISARQPRESTVKPTGSVLIELSMSPMDKGESVGPFVAELVNIIDKSGLDYRLNSMGTVIEGDWDEVMEVVTDCFKHLAQESHRITISIKGDYRKGSKGRLESKVKSIETKLGKKLN